MLELTLNNFYICIKQVAGFFKKKTQVEFDWSSGFYFIHIFNKYAFFANGSIHFPSDL